MLQFQAARLGFGDQPVLVDIDLRIQPGDRIALLGKSGAGKSTLLAAVRQAQESHCAWCPQAPALVPSLSTYHNIYTGGLQRHNALYNAINLLRPWPERLAEITRLCEPLAIAGLLHGPAGELSGGQQQRVSLARAAWQRRPWLLADEPVSALDEQQAEAALGWLLDRHQGGLIALHHVALAESLCNRVIGLRDGRIQFDKPIAAFTAADQAALYQ